MPVLAHLDPLDIDAMKRILVEPKNSLMRQYEKLFDLENIRLTFSQEAIEYVAEKALEFNLGERGLRSICEAIMTDAMFELPSQRDIRQFEIMRL